MNINEIDLWDDRIMVDGQLVARVAQDADPLDARKFHSQTFDLMFVPGNE